MKEYKKLIVVLLALAVLSPLGLYLPDFFGAKSAWGEWNPSELEKMVGYTPKKLAKGAETWQAPMPDYAMAGTENGPRPKRSAEYILSALIGILVCGGIGLVSAKILVRRKNT